MASKTVNARFTNGVLTPLEPLDLPEGILMKLTIQTVDAPGRDSPDQAARKTKFRVVPNHSGLAPGVDAGNLKDIIRDLEDEEFLEKLAP